MALSTYTELQESVAGWLARDDLTSRIPDFIRLLEAKANRDLRCTQMETRSYATVNIAATEPEFISLPGDFQTMRRVRLSSVTGKPKLEFLSMSQADEYRYSTRNVAGQPWYFTVFGDEMELLPTPTNADVLEIVYRANIPALALNSSNWLLTLAPDYYLYGALMEAAPYMDEDERMGTWAAGLKYATDGLNNLATAQSFNSGEMGYMPEGVTP